MVAVGPGERPPGGRLQPAWTGIADGPVSRLRAAELQTLQYSIPRRGQSKAQAAARGNVGDRLASSGDLLTGRSCVAASQTECRRDPWCLVGGAARAERGRVGCRAERRR